MERSASYLPRVRQPPWTVSSLGETQYVMAVVVHSRYIRLVILVSLLQSCVPVLHFPLLGLSQCRNGTQLIEYLMFFLEAQSSEVMFEVLKVELSLSSFVNGPQQAAHFFSRQFFASITHKGNEVFSSDRLPVFTEKREDVRGIEIKGTKQSPMGLHESIWIRYYLLYWMMTYEKSLVVIHSIF